MIEILSIALRTLTYGNYGIFLISAGFISSTVGLRVVCLFSRVTL